MRSTEIQVSLAERRQRLERRANVIRSRLLRTIDVLDARRHEVAHVGVQVKRLAAPVVGIALGVAVLALGVTFALGRVARARKNKLLSVRFGKWIAPMLQPPKPSLLDEVLRKLVLSAVTIVGGQLLRHAATRVLAGRLPDTLLLPETSNAK